MAKRRLRDSGEAMTPVLEKHAERYQDWGCNDQERQFVHAYLRTGDLTKAAGEIWPEIRDPSAKAFRTFSFARVKAYYRALIAIELEDIDIYFIARRLKKEAVEEGNTGGERIAALKILAEAAGMIGSANPLTDGRAFRPMEENRSVDLKAIAQEELDGMDMEALNRLYDKVQTVKDASWE